MMIVEKDVVLISWLQLLSEHQHPEGNNIVLAHDVERAFIQSCRI